jgi:hypothetical protein
VSTSFGRGCGHAWTDLPYSFARQLRTACHGKPGNAALWREVQKVGPRGGLITQDEASQYSGYSEISQEEAEEVSLRTLRVVNNLMIPSCSLVSEVISKMSLVHKNLVIFTPIGLLLTLLCYARPGRFFA